MGGIYLRICSKTDEQYVGKFENTFEQRCRTGWADTNCRDFVNPTVVFLELDVPNDKLQEREYYYIQNLECVNSKGKYIHLSKEEYMKQYYIKIKGETKVCDKCGVISLKRHLPRHKRSNKCINFIKH